MTVGVAFGLTVFCTDQSIDPATAARLAEDAGFSLLLFPDHTHVPADRSTPYPGGGELPQHYKRTLDPFVAATVAAVSTDHLRVGVGVCLVPAREPIGLAKEVASVDLVSGGRFVLGVGAGWNAEEIEHHGVRPRERWAVMREHVLAMKELWSSDLAEFHGDHVDFGPSWSWPKPVQRPHPPILVGGHGDGVLERVIDYGDEWLAMPAPGRAPLADRIVRLQELADRSGRTRPSVSVQAYGSPPPPAVIEQYLASGVDRIDIAVPHGGPDQMVTAIGSLGDLLGRYQ